MSDLLALAERVEAATGPDRELDAVIQRALGSGSTEHWFADFLGNWVTDDHAPAYTASIDAAMTLGGSGCYLAFDVHFMSEENVLRYRGYSFRPDWAKWNPHDTEWLNRDGSENPLCATPALALTAAALRARAASTPSLNAEIAGMGEGR